MFLNPIQEKVCAICCMQISPLFDFSVEVMSGSAQMLSVLLRNVEDKATIIEESIALQGEAAVHELAAISSLLDNYREKQDERNQQHYPGLLS